MRREFLQILSERRALAILILLPLGFTICFGGLFYRNSVTGAPIIVANLDDGSASRNLLRDLRDTPEVKVVEVIGDAAEITTKMLEVGASGAVVIPNDFSEKISRGESVSVELIIDNANTAIGSTVTRAVQSVVSTESAEILVTNRIAAGWDAYTAQNAALSLSTRVLYNPTSGYTDFFLTVLIIHSAQIAIVFLLAPEFSAEKQRRPELFEKPLKILTTKIFLYTAIETAVVALCFAVGIKFFGLICRGSFLDIMVATSLFIFAVVTFALGVGAWVKVPYHAISYTLAYVMPSILFTGAIWPRFSMEKFSLFLSYIMPIGYAANDVRNLFVKGTSAGWESHALALLIFGAIFFALGLAGLKFSGGGENAGDNVARNNAAG